MLEPLRIIVGYFYAIVLGHWCTSKVVPELWRKVTNVEHKTREGSYLPVLVGLLERSLYVACLQMNKGEFIGIWLALKVAGQWKIWSDGLEIDGQKKEGRLFFNIFLIGSGLNVLYAVIGWQLIKAFCTSNFVLHCAALLLLLVPKLVYGYLNRQYKDSANKSIQETP